jgi:hypothetical protein
LSPSGIESARAQKLGTYIGQTGRGLYIPLYQRQYSWGAENIQRLFEDIGYGITRLALNRDPASFLGTTIAVDTLSDVTPSNPDSMPTAVHHIIDGQQRLSTIVILAAELAHALDLERPADSDGGLAGWLAMQAKGVVKKLVDAAWFDMGLGNESEYSRWPRIIRQGEDKWGYGAANAVYSSPIASYLHQAWAYRTRNEPVSDYEPDDRFLRPALLAIRRTLAAIAAGEFDTAEVLGSEALWHDDSVRTQLLGLSPPEDVSSEELHDTHFPMLRLMAVSRFLLEQMQIIEVVAPTEEYAFSIFEPLNTTGQLLTALETFKPLLVQAEGGTRNFPGSPCDVAYASASAATDADSPDQRQRRTADLLTPFALAQTGDKLPRRLSDQRQYLRRTFPEVDIVAQRRYAESVALTADFLREVWDADSPAAYAGDEVAAVAASMLKSSNHTIVQALLSRYFERWVLAGKDPLSAERRDLCEATRAVAAFWTLWRLSRSTTANIDSYHRTLLSDGWDAGDVMIAHIARVGHNMDGSVPSVAQLRSVLINILAIKGNVLSGEDWTQRTGSIQVYASQAVTRFALLAAHHDCQVEHDGRLKPGARGCLPTLTATHWRRNYALEHIAPQQPVDEDPTYGPEVYEQSYQHRLGNLTLVPNAENGSLGRRPWPEKRLMYRVLGTADLDVRQQLLDENEICLQESTLQILDESHYLPFALSVAETDTNIWSVQQIDLRSQNLAWMIWQRLGVGELGAPPIAASDD